jgi:hypothetical protein
MATPLCEGCFRDAKALYFNTPSSPGAWYCDLHVPPMTLLHERLEEGRQAEAALAASVDTWVHEFGLMQQRAIDAETRLHAERHSATINGDQAERAEDRVALLEGLLREVQWDGEPGDADDVQQCTFCTAWKDEGHKPDCRYVAALADGG